MPPPTVDDLSNVIIIDGLPEGVEGDKVGKLTDIVDRVLKKTGTVLQWELVTDEDGKTKGFAFVEYANPKEAESNIAKLQGFKFDKKHVFKLCPFLAWQSLRNVPDEFVPDSAQDRPVENLLYWLLDPAAREQYSIRYAGQTEIQWLDPTVLQKSTEEHSRDNWTELHARWSPKGTYFATFHQQGVQLWGGPSWHMLGRFAHPGVALSDFSPKEKFLVTWANGNLQIWDVKTCQPVKSFQGGPTKQHGWPVFKWSSDEAFFARIVEDNIHIFDSSTMSLIQPNKNQLTTLYIPGVSGFEWSPTENLLAYWVPERGDKPARVVLLSVTRKANPGPEESPVEFTQLTQKNFFLVADIKAHWHDQGDFLGVKVDRMAKKGKDKTKITSFDLFRIRTKSQIAVEMVEIPSDVIAFAWEPKGTRFGVIHKGKTANNVTFYNMGNPKNGTCKKMETLEDRPCDHIFWSPKGNHVVLAGLSSQNTSGPLEFYDVQNKETMGNTEHYLCTDLLWDPSGRYVGTCVSSYRYQMENGFKIWTFQGKLVHSVSKEKFWQFMWRPHPPSLLTEERQKKILKNLKEKASEYERQQKALDEKEAEQLAAEKAKKRSDFYGFYNARKEEMQPLTQARRRARRNAEWDSDDEGAWRQVEETYEEVVSVEETLVEA